jgi:ATP-binding cassette subfamily C (CFTR/MRP) protein 1
MTGQLEARINEGGSNLSQGQRQLISIARALLTPSNILVLDEATAAVDVETDAFLQTNMKSVFKDRTIITIAHRINTILDSDRIVVLDHGRVGEFGTPAELCESGGLFYKLVKEAGLENSVPGWNGNGNGNASQGNGGDSKEEEKREKVEEVKMEKEKEKEKEGKGGE